MVKMLTVLVSTISNSQVFLLKKNMSCFGYSHFSVKILAYMSYLMISFNDTLTNDIINFEQQGPVHYKTDSDKLVRRWTPKMVYPNKNV